MKTLLVVHGLGDSARGWARFAAAMQPSTAVETFDLPGHGEAPPGTDHTFGGLVAALSSAAGGRRLAVLGHSVGGAVAWLYAARNPGLVSHLVLVEPAAPHQSPFIDLPTPEPRHPYSYASLEETLEGLNAIDGSLDEEGVRASYRQRSDGRWEPAFDPAFYPALVDDARTNAAAYRRELGAIRAPTLIVGGERSFMRPAQLEEIALQIPDAHLSTIREGTHFLHRQQTAGLASAVTEFLNDRSLGIPDWI